MTTVHALNALAIVFAGLAVVWITNAARRIHILRMKVPTSEQHREINQELTRMRADGLLVLGSEEPRLSHLRDLLVHGRWEERTGSEVLVLLLELLARSDSPVPVRTNAADAVWRLIQIRTGHHKGAHGTAAETAAARALLGVSLPAESDRMAWNELVDMLTEKKGTEKKRLLKSG